MDDSNIVITAQDVQRLHLNDGDVLVLRLPLKHVSSEVMAKLTHQAERFFPNNKVMILSEDTDVFVIAKSA